MNSFREDSVDPEVNFPTREFFYTVDQVGSMLDMSRKYLEERVLFFYGRSAGSMRGRLKVINLASPEEKPVWRVSETDFKLWLRYKKINFTEARNIRLRRK